MGKFKINFDCQTVYSLAAQQNSFDLFKNIRLECLEKDGGNQPRIYKNLQFKITADLEEFEAHTWSLSNLSEGQSVKLQQQKIRIKHSFLFDLTDEIEVEFKFILVEEENPNENLAQQTQIVRILPANQWAGEKKQPELIAAFVKPNGLYVESLVKKVSEVLNENGHGKSVDGYQSGYREKPWLMAAALWEVLRKEKIGYVSPPPSFSENGQLIRFASDISNQKIAACLDLSLLIASCIELMGLNPVLFFTKEHAFVGVWLVSNNFSSLIIEDALEIRKKVDSKDLVLIESTLIATSQAVTFSQAESYARNYVEEENETDFLYAIDIAQARSRKIKPLATVEEKNEEIGSDLNEQIKLPIAPVLPPVNIDEILDEETPETRVDRWKRKLLDLSKSNPLISLRANAAAIKIFCPDISRLEDRLADEDLFTFKSAESIPSRDLERSGESYFLKSGRDIDEEYAIEQLDKKIIMANMTENKLESVSLGLFRKSKNDLEEGGVNTLFISIGMLNWKEEGSDKTYKAPLVLLPVSLERKSAKAKIKLRINTSENPVFNLTLIEFLKQDYDIDLSRFKTELPEDDFGLDINAIMQVVRSSISEQPGFEVIEECYVASFSFSKYIMWVDISERLNDLKENLFVNHLIEKPNSAYNQTSSFIESGKLDRELPAGEIFTPLNCDSSQLVAVDASTKNQDFVLEGPPGTGKSETIANIIAHNISLGRKVLFVAEKIAALNVVYKRLKNVGLDRIVLELHSNKSSKRAVLDQLRNSTNISHEKFPVSWEKNTRIVTSQRDKLNRVVSEVHRKSRFGISPWEAISRSTAFDKDHKLRFDWDFTYEDCPFSPKSDEGLIEVMSICDKAGHAFMALDHIEVTSFKCVSISDWSHTWQRSFVSSADTIVSILNDLSISSLTISKHLKSSINIVTLNLIGSIKSFSELLDLHIAKSVDYVVPKSMSEFIALPRFLGGLRDLAKKKQELEQLVASCDFSVDLNRLNRVSVSGLISKANELKNKWWIARIFSKRALKIELEKNGVTGVNNFSNLYKLSNIQELQSYILKLSYQYSEVGLWQDWSTSAAELIDYADRGDVALRLLSDVLKISDDNHDLLENIHLLCNQGCDSKTLDSVLNDKINFDKCFDVFNSEFEKLKDLGFEVDLQRDCSDVLEDLRNINKFQSQLKLWIDWVAAKNELSKVGLSVVESYLDSGLCNPPELGEHVKTAFCKWLVPTLIDNRENLRCFKAFEHEALISEFRKSDALLAKLTGLHILNKHQEFVPDINDKANQKNFGVLARELQKKTRHKAIRSLFADLGDRLLELTPCLMMSPLSVAQFLPSDFKSFDLVVFDEASQITPWDAVGAIARGKNVIVVGDPKQMPPTNFFNKANPYEDEDEEDLESILDQALAAGLPHKRLTGHYRSKHESLIAFSNSKYYQNSLVTYPSTDTKLSAVSHKRVNGLYSKGRDRNNPKEAQSVVDDVVRRLLDDKLNKLSIGVVAFNSEQQRKILDLFDDARRKYPEIEKFWIGSNSYDPVFVKNLESVQGDERDVILFSMNFGPTEPDASNMSMNFGPLNKQGGERRLNVAVTRATTEVVVFSSFDSSMIDLSRTSALGVEHLKHYLEFAERGPIALSEQTFADYGQDQFDSIFEHEVAMKLRDLGWKVQTQVGQSGFRIDLGIIHPDHPGKYLAGVECDGAMYHSSPTARDRDRIRHEVLVNKGWNLIRLWSTEFFRDPKFAIGGIDRELKSLLENDRKTVEIEESTISADEIISVIEDSDVEGSVVADGENLKNSDQVNGVVEPSGSAIASELSHGFYPSGSYFEGPHKPILKRLAQQILSERPCITFKSLALEIAQRHGKGKTSKKQISHLRKIVNPWAGYFDYDTRPSAYWRSPSDVAEIVPWRGIDPFGYDRVWSEIAYPECLGLAKFALEKNQQDPVDCICKEFRLKRRVQSTLHEFSSWIEDYKTFYS